MTMAILSIIGNLVKDMTAAEILANLEEEGKKARVGTRNLLVRYMILKFQKPILTIWWNVNVCAIQVMTSYESSVNLFDRLYKSRQGVSISSTVHNIVALGKSKKLKCDRALFCAFSRAY